jgi:hypothetical protein
LSGSPTAFVGGAVTADDDAGLVRWVQRRVKNTLTQVRRAELRRRHEPLDLVIEREARAAAKDERAAA